MFLLLVIGGKFGVSSTFRTICSYVGAGKKVSFFDFNKKNERWNLVFVLGALVGGYLSEKYLKGSLSLSSATIEDLNKLGISFQGSLLPNEVFNWENLLTLKGILILIVGGFLAGFGARWAGGCTSGHAISGLSNLQLPSLIAVIGFFIGGLIMTHLLFPLIFS